MICVPRFYPGAGPVGGGASAADGTLDYPYQATGADYAAVQTALGALSASDGDFAIAFITGGAEYLLQYVSADTAWYAPDGGDGSQLSPYWTATASGSGALALLRSPYTDAYGVIAKGSGSPVAVRALEVIDSGSGYVVPYWVPVAVHALGAPDTGDTVNGYPDPNDWSIAIGGSVAISAGLLTMTSDPINVSLVQTTASRGTATHLGLFFTGFAVAGVTTTFTQSLVRVNSSSDSGQLLIVEWGGVASPGGQTTKLNVYNNTGTKVDSGVTLASLTYWGAVLDVASNTLTIYSDGVSVYSASSVFTNADTYRAKFQTESGVSGSTITFATHAAVTWT
jgi:hypothetical protein